MNSKCIDEQAANNICSSHSKPDCLVEDFCAFDMPQQLCNFAPEGDSSMPFTCDVVAGNTCETFENCFRTPSNLCKERAPATCGDLSIQDCFFTDFCTFDGNVCNHDETGKSSVFRCNKIDTDACSSISECFWSDKEKCLPKVKSTCTNISIPDCFKADFCEYNVRNKCAFVPEGGADAPLDCQAITSKRKCGSVQSLCAWTASGSCVERSPETCKTMKIPNCVDSDFCTFDGATCNYDESAVPTKFRCSDIYTNICSTVDTCFWSDPKECSSVEKSTCEDISIPDCFKASFCKYNKSNKCVFTSRNDGATPFDCGLIGNARKCNSVDSLCTWTSSGSCAERHPDTCNVLSIPDCFSSDFCTFDGKECKYDAVAIPEKFSCGKINTDACTGIEKCFWSDNEECLPATKSTCNKISIPDCFKADYCTYTKKDKCVYKRRGGGGRPFECQGIGKEANCNSVDSLCTWDSGNCIDILVS